MPTQKEDHKNALENIRNKCLGTVKNLKIQGVTFVLDSFFDHLNSLGKDVLKIRSNWIDYYDIFKIFFNTLGMIPLAVENKRMNETTSLWEILGEEKGQELANRLFDAYISIPRDYDIYFPLPNFKFEITQRVEVTPYISFHTYKDLQKTIRPSNLSGYLDPEYDLSTKREDTYLRLKLSGFFGNNLDSSLPKESLDFLKIIIFFGLQHETFKHDQKSHKRQGLLSNPNSIDINRLYIYSEDINSNYSIIDRIELPLEIILLLESIFLNFNFFDELAKEFKEIKYRDQVANLMLLRSFNGAKELYRSTDEELLPIKAAVLWYIDSLSNENKTLSFLQLCIGLEAIFGDLETENSLTSTLADRCAYVVGKNIKERSKIRKRFKDLYKIRSKIVHGKILSLDRSDEGFLNWGRFVLKQAIWQEIKKSELIVESGKNSGTKIVETKET